MLDNDIIVPSKSDWSSPCILVPKPDGTYRLCTDFRKVNSVTKTDSYPIPKIDDCINKIGNAKFVSKFDLLKDFWQVPLTERAKFVCICDSRWPIPIQGDAFWYEKRASHLSKDESFSSTWLSRMRSLH
jgi:hypothetical protein